MRGNELTILSPATSCHPTFQIPMRGNEYGDNFRVSLDGGTRFQIPMRGNEQNMAAACLAAFMQFQIPMRGNEKEHKEHVFNYDLCFKSP